MKWIFTQSIQNQAWIIVLTSENIIQVECLQLFAFNLEELEARAKTTQQPCCVMKAEKNIALESG